MQLPSTVGASEPLARYLTQSSYYHLPTNSVKPKAFEPPSDLRLSVFRINGLTIEEVWENGQVNVVSKRSPPPNLYGIAKITALAVRGVNLNIEPDEPPLRHACIVGWTQEKSERVLLTQELAARANLILRSQN